MTKLRKISISQLPAKTEKLYHRNWENQYRSLIEELGAAHVHVGHTFSKTFSTGTYFGIVTATDVHDKTGSIMYHVKYEDDDEEDLFLEEFKATIPTPISEARKGWCIKQILEEQLYKMDLSG